MTSAYFQRAARVAFHRSGGLELVRYWNRKACRILMYHRFPAPANNRNGSLEKQCAHLRKHYRLASLTEVGRWLREGSAMPSNVLVVTVDDGYRDFFSTAYPIFSAYHVPVTVFLATDFVDRKSWLWTDIVKYAFEHALEREFEWKSGSGEIIRFRLGSAEQRRTAALTVKEAAKKLPNQERLKLVQDLPGLLKTEFPMKPPEQYAPLHWDEVRTMARDGIEFGAHTKSHPILSRVSDETILREEIEGSKQRIEQELERPVLHFCYPNGHWEDFEARSVDLARSAGFQTAVTTSAGLVGSGDDPMLLRRIGVEPVLPELYFRECAAGFRIA